VPEGRATESVRAFGCFTVELEQLADWLTECGIETVAMESTGVYWLSLFQILERRVLKSHDTIAAALSGDYRDEHVFVLQQELSLYDAYGSQLSQCDQQIEQCLSQFVDAAAEMLPLPARPKGKKSSRNAPSQAFRLAAQAVGNSHSALGAFYRRLRSRLGAPKAITATAHKLARLFYRLWTTKEAFVDQGADVYEQKYPERVLRNLKKRASEMGFELISRPSQAEVS
jgi:hypothetical protein